MPDTVPRSSLSSAPEPEVADSVPVSERSGINQPFAIEGDALPELNLTFAGREDPLDEHTMPNSELGADEAPESEKKLADLTEEIKSGEKVVQATPEGHGDLPMLLNNLGKLYRSRFKLTGKLADISEAILSGQKAVELTPEGNVALPVYLTSLGLWFESRFKCTGNMVDLAAAISSKRQAIHLTPAEHTTPTELADLGDLYLRRWERTGSKADISEAILCLEKAINLTPSEDLNVPAQLNTLGTFYTYRFECTGNVADLSEAITSIHKSIHVTEEGDSKMHKRLDNLASSYYSRFEKTRNLADLSEAISSREKAIRLTPNGHPDIPVTLYNLAYSYDTLFQHTGRRSDLDKAVSNYSMAIDRSPGIPIFKLHANKRLAKISQELYPLQSIDAYSTAIQLASYLAGLHETIEMRLNNLQHISDVSTLAAACAFKLGNFNLALEWLEQGRCVVWGQINDLRTPIDVLRAKHPDLADDIVRVSSGLEIHGSQSSEDANFRADSIAERTTPGEENAKLALEWNQLLAKVRTLPDFEDFIQPLSYSVISEHLPKSGPVILINVHEDRCDALALVPGTNRPIHIPLPEFTHEKSVALRDHLQANLRASGIRMREAEPLTRGIRPFSEEMGLGEILRQLWVWVVKPILDALGYSEHPSDSRRIWWCVTGPLAFLPIHAAGIYSEHGTGVGSILSDFAISSYIPTIRALFDRAKTGPVLDNTKSGLFMISQPNAPGLPSIPQTTEEVKVIQRLTKDCIHRVRGLEGPAGTVDRTSIEMEAYSSVHFACHASQNASQPLKSGFSLHDGRLELSSIIQKRLVGADLAFLSACQTSTGDGRLSEEAVHLAAGMLAAGYRGVVATMWSIRDRYASGFAEDFYTNLIEGENCFSGEHAARAVHHATQNLRRKLALEKLDLDLSLLVWVPYVHFGL